MNSEISKKFDEKNKHCIIAVDNFLTKELKEMSLQTRKNQNEILTKFCQILLNCIGKDDISQSGNPINGIFSDALTEKDKRLIAVCLFRLLNIYEPLFDDETIKFKTLKLFDEVLSKDVYKTLDIQPKEQTFHKRSKLIGVLNKIEEEFSLLISEFDNFGIFQEFRHKFMQKINDQLVRAFIWPFIPREIVDLRLKELFKTIEEFLDAEISMKFQAYKRAKETVDKFCKEAKSYGTKYSLDILESLGKKLRNLIDEEFQKSPISKPAFLEIHKVEKKYPFDVVGKEVGLRFLIKNIGTGFGFDIEIDFDATLEIKKSKYFISQIEPSASIEIELECIVDKVEKIVLVEPKIRWRNYDNSEGFNSFYFELEGQRTDINWESLEKEDPYSLEPATTDRDLVGRKEILSKLESLIKSQSVDSAFIWGQKRVGKTSIVKTLKNKLENLGDKSLYAIYLEGGDYINPEPKITIENLGRKLCREIQNIDIHFRNINIPNFDSSLSPLSDFLESVIELNPKIKILFILDEFDELPIDLYKRTPLGDSFFLSIRSISGKSSFGFILVGSEKMEFIMNCQGDALNKFLPIRVDYFNKEQHWADFQDLVRRPVKNWMEISDEAISLLYYYTAGNPFFTKQICKSLYGLMVKRRDCHITKKEMEEAIGITLENAAVNMFMHFWEDGIFETGIKAEEVSVNRRKLLLALAETLRKSNKARRENISEEARNFGLKDSFIDSELREFERRQVLISNKGHYKCKVYLFEKWLLDNGTREIILRFTDYDEFLRIKEEEERLRVTSKEIVESCSMFGLYRGKRITEDQVRNWLNQFGSNENQRLMFELLKCTKFYSQENIRAKMKLAHDIVKRGLVFKKEEGKRKRHDIIVSYLDHPGKSGAYLAKLYADENDIYYENIIEKSKLSSVLEKKSEELKSFALVFIDDFIATGDSACEYFAKLNEENGSTIGRLLAEKGEIEGLSKLQIFFIAICGYQESRDKLKKVLEDLKLNVRIHLCDPLDESDKAFSEKSKIFPDEFKREKAKNIAFEFGSKLVKNAPLGYGNCQSTVVFEHNCPNNTLPILWAESKTWIPLFPRL